MMRTNTKVRRLEAAAAAAAAANSLATQHCDLRHNQTNTIHGAFIGFRKNNLLQNTVI